MTMIEHATPTQREMHRRFMEGRSRLGQFQIPKPISEIDLSRRSKGVKGKDGRLRIEITAPQPEAEPIEVRYEGPVVMPNGGPVVIAEIIEAVCGLSGIRKNELLSSRRTANVVAPRHLAIMLAKLLTDRSFPQIGRQFGGRDHTTVMHAVRKYEPVADILRSRMPEDARVIDWTLEAFRVDWELKQAKA